MWAVAAVAVVTSCTTPRHATLATGWQSVAIGLCEDYPEETRTLTKAREDLAAVRATGATVLRIAFGWDAMEPERGRYDWSFWDDYVAAATREFGLTLIPYICYTPRWAARDAGENFWRSPPRDPEDFGRFVTALVRRYGHVIHTWELWNEPDNAAYWLGTVDDYAALVHAGSRAVRSADPRARVVLGGIATELPFLQALFERLHVAPDVDIVNLHTYLETWHPDPLESLPDYLERAADIVRTHGEAEPLWLAEAGYSSVGERAKVSDVYRAHWQGEHTDAAQAAALVRLFLLALGTERVSLIAWYRINDLEAKQEVIGDDNNRHLGIRTASGQPKLAIAALTQLATRFAQPYRVLGVPVRVVTSTTTAPIVKAFTWRDGRILVAAWMAHGESLRAETASPAPDTRQARVTVELPFPVHRAQLTDATGRSVAGENVVTATGANTTQVTLDVRGGEVRLWNGAR